MSGLLLDTSACIDIMRRRRDGIAPFLLARSEQTMILSSIVMAELEFGWALSDRPVEGRAQFAELAARCELRVFDGAAAACYGPLRAYLRRLGQDIGPNDLFIAAHALSLEATVITGNVAEFKRVPGLTVESWRTTA